jgi:hypothetical protein
MLSSCWFSLACSRLPPLRSESVGAGGQSTGSDTASIAFARRTTSCCPAQSFPLNQQADPPQSNCPAAIDDLQKGPAMAVKLVERNLTLSLPFCKRKKPSAWPVIQNFMVFPPNPGRGVTLPASTAEHG